MCLFYEFPQRSLRIRQSSAELVGVRYGTYEDILPVLTRQVLVGGFKDGIVEGVRLRSKHCASTAARIVRITIYSIRGKRGRKVAGGRRGAQLPEVSGVDATAQRPAPSGGMIADEAGVAQIRSRHTTVTGSFTARDIRLGPDSRIVLSVAN